MITSHSSSVTSVWYRLVSRICCFRVVGVHMATPGLVSATPWNHIRLQPLNPFRNGLLEPLRCRATCEGANMRWSCLLSALVLIEASLVMAPRAATAQDYPAKQITLVVAFAPAGSADSVTRIVVDRPSARLGGVSIVVENRGGAGGNLAAKQVAAATADGYTVLVTTTAVAINE